MLIYIYDINQLEHHTNHNVNTYELHVTLAFMYFLEPNTAEDTAKMKEYCRSKCSEEKMTLTIIW